MIPSPARLLTGLLAVLALLLAVEWLLPDAPPPPSSVPLSHLRGSTRAASLPARETAVWGETILARPVFSISRRPPKIAAKGSSETPAGQSRLAGIMITRSGRRAIFAPEGGGKQMVLAEGSMVNQSTIRSILPDRVVLAGGAVLRPTYDRNRAASLITTPPFQPPTTFQPPSFQPPGFQQNGPNFQPTVPGLFGTGNPLPGGLPQPGGPQGIPVPHESDGDDAAPQRPPIPPAMFRGTIIPQRRE